MTEPTNQYVPFLKGKAGEIKALGRLGDRDGVTPLLEVPAQKVLYGKTGISIEPVERTLSGYAQRLASAWGKLDFCFVDLAQLDRSVRMPDGRHPVAAFFEDARRVDLAAVPVVGLDRDGAHLEAAEDAYKARPTGVALRLRRADMSDSVDLARQLPKFLRLIDQAPEQVDLLLDFGELLSAQIEEVKVAARAAMVALAKLGAWRSFVLCSGSFPAQVSQFIKPKENGSRPRREWSLWQEICASLPTGVRVPSFADYGATGAEWGPPFNPKTMNPAAKIVYATEAEWLIVRGRSFRENGGAQYRSLASRLVKEPRFKTDDGCEVGAKIRRLAVGRGPTGNLEQWVSEATLRHIEVVRRQLANSGGDASGP